MRALFVVAMAVTVLASACGSSNGAVPPPSESSTPPASSSPGSTPPSSRPDLARVHVRLVRIATLQSPVALAIRAGDPSLYIAEKIGVVVAIRGGRVDPRPVLDLTGHVTGGSEQGLLGLAFSPDGRFLYVNYTDTSGNTNVVQFTMKAGRADPATRRQILFVQQPFSNHNGGDLAFGPDGYLYVGLGDGGSEGDPQRNGQRLSTFLAKMLRIAPRTAGGYSVPRDNPFVGRPGVRPEIWAYGLRNPWRYSFDRQTGDLWIGDVGQNKWEEIDVQRARSRGGQNYGWSLMEGDHPYNGTAPPGAIPPIDEYSHAGGACAIVGGYVYRGTRIPALRGAYVFGDFCAAPVMALVEVNGKVVQRRTLPISVPYLASFGEDQNGELYALSLDGPVYRLDP